MISCRAWAASFVPHLSSAPGRAIAGTGASGACPDQPAPGLADGLGLAEGLGLADGLGLAEGLGLADTVGLTDGLGLAGEAGLADGLDLMAGTGLLVGAAQVVAAAAAWFAGEVAALSIDGAQLSPLGCVRFCGPWMVVAADPPPRSGIAPWPLTRRPPVLPGSPLPAERISEPVWVIGCRSGGVTAEVPIATANAAATTATARRIRRGCRRSGGLGCVTRRHRRAGPGGTGSQAHRKSSPPSTRRATAEYAAIVHATGAA